MPRRGEREPERDEWPIFDEPPARRAIARRSYQPARAADPDDPGDYDDNDPWLEMGDPGEWNL